MVKLISTLSLAVLLSVGYVSATSRYSDVNTEQVAQEKKEKKKKKCCKKDESGCKKGSSEEKSTEEKK